MLLRVHRPELLQSKVTKAIGMAMSSSSLKKMMQFTILTLAAKKL